MGTERPMRVVVASIHLVLLGHRLLSGHRAHDSSVAQQHLDWQPLPYLVNQKNK